MIENIMIASLENIDVIIEMALKLWPDNKYNELEKEFIDILESENEEVLLYKLSGKYVGFIQISLRNDYVEGSDYSPTGYLEGIYVEVNHRKKGIAKALVEEGENWAKGKGCKQMGSDVEFHNNESFHFHKSIGYNEVNRIVCFLKDL